MSFRLGPAAATAGVRAETRRNPGFEWTVQSCPGRHAAGDWGDVADEDREMNEEAVRSGNDMIMSSYFGEKEL